MTRARLLVVEDDHAIRIALEEKLELEGYDATTVDDGVAACTALGSNAFDLVILDLMLPKLDGFEVLRWVRSRRDDLPVLILSAKGRESDKVVGLRAGADDYLAKPFGLAELMARVEALLRRARGFDRSVQLGDVELDIATGSVTKSGAPVELSRKELDILLYLLRHRGSAMSRQDILDAVWGHLPSSAERAIDFHVLNLRRKLEDAPHAPVWLVTRHGRGYEIVG